VSQEAEGAALATDIATFIESGIPDDSTFNALALRVFTYQFQWNLPYRRFCTGKGVRPESITHWRGIPAAPAAAFKHFELTCAPKSDCNPESGGRVFHSSGTTGRETSRHFMDAAGLFLYRTSLKAAYAHFVPEWTAGILALMPPTSEAPHSSLSFMLEELKAQFWWEVSDANNKYSWTDKVRFWMQEQRKSYTVFGTAFAWVHFFDTVPESFTLPEGCVVLETGGFKGRSREVSRDELYVLFTDRLGMPPTHCVSEYGMSEMASQFYDSTLLDATRGKSRPVRKVAPYWLKTRILDPITGAEAAMGQPGLLAHYDLANLNSVLAIQTEDYGSGAEDGDGFLLLGRAPGAVLRGCSLLAEDQMNSQ
jgi:hypothetical protein